LKPEDLRGEVALSLPEFEMLCRDARVLERRQGRPVLLAHAAAGGTPLLTRVWYARGRWSSDRLWPYSERFRYALGILAGRGIQVPEARAWGNVTGSDIRYLSHDLLEGTPLRAMAPVPALKSAAAFIWDLHAHGVYCRSLSLGSMIALPEGGFALQDVSDTRLLDGPLPARMRERNLGILCAHPEDLDWMMSEARWSDLVMEYCRVANLSVAAAARMRERVRLQMARRQARRRWGGYGAELATILELPGAARSAASSGAPETRTKER
jgi:hypothetical protein